jgi:hypothetical protein
MDGWMESRVTMEMEATTISNYDDDRHTVVIDWSDPPPVRAPETPCRRAEFESAECHHHRRRRF